MGTVLIAWELGGGLGHCTKLAPIAEGLIDRGHRVVFASRDVVTSHRVMRGLKVTHLQAPILLAKPLSPVEHPSNFAHILHNTGFGDEEQLSALIGAWANLFDAVSPDLVICEHAPVALLASRLHHLRRVVIGTGFSLPPNVAPFPELRDRGERELCDLDAHESTVLDRVNRILLRGSCPPLARLGELYDEVDASFLMSFSELDHHSPGRDERYYGVCSSSCGATVEWPEGIGPRIFVYLKPSGGRGQVGRILDLLSDLPVRAIAHVPGGQFKEHWSPSVQVFAAPIDIASVASECDVAILNGTAGAGTQFLLAGVPLLLIPLYLEQVAFSRRVLAMGAGVMVDPNRPEQIAAKLFALLQDTRYRDGAKKFAARYATFNPEEQLQSILNRIESLISLEGGEPPRVFDDAVGPQGVQALSVRSQEVTN